MSGAMGAKDFDVGTLIGQVQRVARLDTTVFDEVRDSQSQTLPAVVVVAVSMLIASLGSWIWLLAEDFPDLATGDVLLKILLLGTVAAFALWIAWALITQVVLLNLFSIEADRMALMRTMGFAAAPAALAILILIPTLSMGFGVAALVAWFSLTNYAIHSAAPTATSRQVVVANLAGFTVFAVVMAILSDSNGITSGVFIHGADWTEYFDRGGFSF